MDERKRLAVKYDIHRWLQCLVGARGLLFIGITHENPAVSLLITAQCGAQGDEETVPQNIWQLRVHRGAHDRSLRPRHEGL